MKSIIASLFNMKNKNEGKKINIIKTNYNNYKIIRRYVSL